MKLMYSNFEYLANSYLIGDSYLFTPTAPGSYVLTCVATDKYKVTETRSYTLTVQKAVSFTAIVNPSLPVVNDGSKIFVLFKYFC